MWSEMVGDLQSKASRWVKGLRMEMCGWACGVQSMVSAVLCGGRGRQGQGTTEYAILVGVLVVIAIAAVTAFRGRLQGLWDSITAGINGL